MLVKMAKRKSTVTMADLQKAAGVRSRQAIKLWVDAGLLPPPTMVPGPSGRGRRGVWPASALERVKFIRTKTAEGRNLREVLAELWAQDQPKADDFKKRVDAIVGRWTAAGKHARPKDLTVQQEWIASIEEILVEEVGLFQEVAHLLAHQAGDNESLEQALDLYFRGFEPILVISKGEVWISSSTVAGFEHSWLVHTMLRGKNGLGYDRAVGRVTVELYTVIADCLAKSSDNYDEVLPRRMLVPGTIVEEIDPRSPYRSRRITEPFLNPDGTMNARVLADRLILETTPSADAAFTALEKFGPESTTELSAPRKKLGATAPRKKSTKRKPAAGPQKKGGRPPTKKKSVKRKPDAGRKKKPKK